ncbi:hypothetical protein [Sphingomonas zeae]
MEAFPSKRHKADVPQARVLGKRCSHAPRQSEVLHTHAADMPGSHRCRHGVAANAQRMRSFTAGCGKAACTRNIVYRFTPHGQNQSVEGRLSLSTSHHDHEEYDYVMATNTLPILYDPRNPSRAMFVWRDQIGNRASPRKMWDFILIINLIFAGAATPLGLMMAWSIRRQRAKARVANTTPA